MNQDSQNKSADQDQTVGRIHALEVAQPTQAATQAGAVATLTATQAGAATTEAAVQAGTMATMTAAQAGTVSMMVAGGVALVVGVFLGLAISNTRRG